MKKLIVTKKMYFSAAHRIFNPDFDDQKNAEIFGQCANYFGHGHNYTIEVHIEGQPESDTGYIVDLKKLSNLIHDKIITPCDHKHLNYQVEFLKDVIPTVENLALHFFSRLKPEIKTICNGRLCAVKVWENENNCAEYSEL